MRPRPPRTARSRSRGAGRRGRSRRRGCRRAARGSASPSPSTRGASPDGRRPTGSPMTARRGLVALPQREVVRVLLRGVDLLARLHVLEATMRELAVAGEPPDAEVHAAVRRGIGHAAIDQRRDERQHLGDVLRGARLDGRVCRQPSQAASSPKAAISRSVSAVVDSPSSAARRMILSSMSVKFRTNVTRWPRARR